ncbi:hypothetical protein [Ciceribacter ferrooxidans]|uniref:Uncharacterized protein n=1 Tax=Ciceribacter ferrooxidans TaxID=2509717 RepID=A0A4Q2SZT6_9HYPH|nr:hypothetical protein [Ciceribacter ferrooxidans]RYC10144.1 hypothetical protein EUU22_18940 [Ciceribacter ferrooxidans]
MTDEERNEKDRLAQELIEELLGQQFAAEALLTQLIWKWALGQSHPPTELAAFFRPVEEQMQALERAHPTRRMKAARARTREIAEELGRLLHHEALRRTGGQGQVQ